MTEVDPFEAEEARRILELALEPIATVLRGSAPTLPGPERLVGRLGEPGASFVTLERGGELLGCVGTTTPRLPLGADVAVHALGAAFADPRLPPVRTDDYEAMDVKVSVLSPLEPLLVDGPDDLRAALVPGRDGLLVEAPTGSATFLPSVWRHLTEPYGFVGALWRKAGWPPGSWPPGLSAWTYRTVELTDPGPRSLHLAAQLS